MTSAPPAMLAAVRGLTKAYGAFTALDRVDLDLHSGEIHALIGENGAGKSTLTKLLAGLETPTDGSIEIGGEPVDRLTRKLAAEHGIGLVQQHFTLIPTYTAEENIALARPKGRLRARRPALIRRLNELSERYDLPVRPRIPARELSVGEQQRLEILRALDSEAKILLLDEPTAVLVDAESDRLLALCRDLADAGRAIMIVTHRLSEVLQAADRLTVLRHGKVVLTTDSPSAYSRSGLARAMIGESDDSATPRPRRPAPKSVSPVLSVNRVSHGRLTDCSFDLHGGEIIGIAGVDGNGQAELESALVGTIEPEHGAVTWHDRQVRPGRPRDLPPAGIGYVPSDRHERALALPLTLADNLELGRGPVWRAGRKRRLAAAAEELSGWDVRGGTPGAPAARLSGGNAQKVVLARELAGDPEVVIAAYPTRGLDPGAAAAIADRLLNAVVDRQTSVVWFGAELDELLAVADRIIVLVTGLPCIEMRPPFDRNRIGEAMAGVLAETAPELAAGPADHSASHAAHVVSGTHG